MRAARQLTLPHSQPATSSSAPPFPQVTAPLPAKLIAAPQTQPPQQPQRHLPVQHVPPPTHLMPSGMQTVTDTRQPVPPTVGSMADRLTRALLERDNTVRENQTLTQNLVKSQQHNIALSKWAEAAKASIGTHKNAIDGLNQEIATTRTQYNALKQELEAYKATNAELRSQVGDLMARNSAVNASAIRFREDLWHSEMRWRDATCKLEKSKAAEESLKSLSGKCMGHLCP